MKSLNLQVTGTIVFVAMLLCAWFMDYETRTEKYHTSQVTAVHLYHAFVDGTIMQGDNLHELWYCQDANYDHYYFNVEVGTNVFGHETRTYKGGY